MTKHPAHTETKTEGETTYTEVAATTPVTTPITIQKFVFQAPAPYSAGIHELTAGEASALNRVLAENLRNNFAPTIKKATEGGAVLDADDLQAKFAAYAASYAFASGRASKSIVDPVEKEAHRIAKEHVTTALKNKGFNMKNLPEGAIAKYVADYLATKPAKVYDEARARVNAASEGATSALAALGL